MSAVSASKFDLRPASIAGLIRGASAFGVYETASTLEVAIVRFVDEAQPGFVACEFIDADGSRHTVIDKLPIFTKEDLWLDSKYPAIGGMRCRVLESFEDVPSRKLRITIVEPDDLETTEGKVEFLVLESQVLVDDRA